ncbi:MAG TPA: hypothetical protein VG409_17445, partial [Actinomycetota bacterium]|nr:hypothetical protein [Actinomycetota bacterium]
HGSVRVSVLHDATEADVDRLLEVLPAAVADLREMAELDTQAIENAAEGPGRRGPGSPEGVPRSDKIDPRGGAPVGREGR